MKDTRRIAIVPVYNEEKTLEEVLNKAAPLVDLMVLIDDKSLDDSVAVIRHWQRRRSGIWLLRHARNRGMAQALKSGFFFAARLLEAGVIRPRDILINFDADGQHPIEEIPEAASRMLVNDLDILLVVRDFSCYPRYKVIGNRFLTTLARWITGYPYRDVESGFRFIRARCLSDFLPYFTGWKYSCAQEIAIITALQGLRIRNDYAVRINYYRPGTTMMDGFAVFVMSFLSALQVKLEWRSSPFLRDAHLATVSVEPPPGG